MEKNNLSHSQILDLLMDAIGQLGPLPLLELLSNIDGAIDWEMVESRVGTLVDEGEFDNVKSIEDAKIAVKGLS